MSYNKIFYGAPGVGKSYGISKEVKDGMRCIVTFHPEYSYYDFVGGYKPNVKMAEDNEVYYYYDQTTKIVGSQEYTAKRNKMLYEFKEGPFLNSYVDAWKQYLINGKDVYLIIEELNRGNCAAVFGDVFQLLDRDKYGFSEYYINVNKEIAEHLRKTLGIAYEIEIKTILAAKGLTPPKDIFSILLLPRNLVILATMNTSDQSLFPLDSAFKRRWIWEYVPINYSATKLSGRVIDINGSRYNWGEFLEVVNYIIYKLTESEDKCLGPYFVKEDIITEGIFKGKILYYLWFEVFKDEPVEIIAQYLPMSEKSTPNNSVENCITYSEFYDEEKGTSYINKFMEKIAVTALEDNEEETTNATNDENESNISLNGNDSTTTESETNNIDEENALVDGNEIIANDNN